MAEKPAGPKSLSASFRNRKVLGVALVIIVVIGLGGAAYYAVGPGATGSCALVYSSGQVYRVYDYTAAECDAWCEQNAYGSGVLDCRWEG